MKTYSLFLSVLLSLPLTAVAAPVDQLIQSAIRNNPEIQLYEAEITAAKAGKRTAGALDHPEFAIEAGGKNVRGLGDGPVWRAELAQTLEFPGRVALRKAIADRDIALAELGLLQFKASLSNAVRAKAGEIALLHRRTEAIKSVHQRLQELIDVLVQRDTGSVSAKLERRILEATLVTTDRSLTDARKESSEATTRLNLLTGRAPDAELTIDSEPPALPAAPTLDALKALAAKSNFELQQKRVQLARQGLQIDFTKTDRWSQFTFGPYIGGERASDKQVEGGIVFSIPLPLWNKKTQANVEVEQARQKGAEAMLAATLRDLERDLTIERANYAAELEALTHWRSETEKEFQDAAAEADRHYRLGAVPASTYVEMQRGYLEALDALVQTRRNAWQHRMELERLTGTNLEVKP